MKRSIGLLLLFPALLFAQLGNYAVSFDGATGYVAIPHNDVFYISKVTIEMWVYWWNCGGSGDLDFLLAKGNEQWEIHTSGGSGNNGLRFIPTVGVYLDTPLGIFTSAAWHHIAFLYDPSTSFAQCRIDGAEVTLTLNGTNPLSTAMNTSSNELRIGRRGDGGYPFCGKIDEVRIWNTIRTPTEILSNKDRELTGNETGLVTYYTMNEGTGTTIADAQQNHLNNGTLMTGAAWTSNSVSYQTSSSQKRMVTYKKDGSRDYAAISIVDSVKFTSDTLMAVVGAGTFIAGTTEVTMSGFSIDKYEVTDELWTLVRNWAVTHGYSDLPEKSTGYKPVSQFTWFDAVKWCNARSEKDGYTPVYYMDAAKTTVYRTGTTTINTDAVKWTANGYRLPTEAEWEYAAKGGPSAQPTPNIYSGANIVGGVAWYDGNSFASTQIVGKRAPNELGIYDMSGNVQEWCWDWSCGTYPSGTSDPKGPVSTQTDRVLRGGSYDNSEPYCRNVTRNSWDPNYSLIGGGFRCVQD